MLEGLTEIRGEGFEEEERDGEMMGDRLGSREQLFVGGDVIGYDSRRINDEGRRVVVN